MFLSLSIDYKPMWNFESRFSIVEGKPGGLSNKGNQFVARGKSFKDLSENGW